MQNRGRGPRSLGRLFVTHAAVSLVPVLALGGVLAWSYQGEARQRGVAEGRSEAILVAQTAIEPVLDARPLTEGLSQHEKTELNALVARAVGEHHVLRLRLRDLNGQVVYSDDGSGFSQRPEDEALEAASGEVVARLTRLNTDTNDRGRAGVAAVEVYQPLTAGPDDSIVGVLELYLPYAPISSDVTAGLHRLYLDLSIGLALLYIALFAISASVSRGLRREVKLTTFLANHDPLTELPNRAMFHRRAADSIERSRRSGRQVAVAIFDLDRFKEVNDTLGHHNGDKLLIEIARRLERDIGRNDTVARLGGDEFGVILSDAIDAEATLWRLREVINQEIEVSGLPLSIDASIGFSVAAEDGTVVEDLVQHADVAMYMAKSQHAGVTRYAAELDHYDTANLALIAELRHAIEAGQLTMHYQPKASIADNRVEAVEALVRWRHPTHGLLYPDRFIPLAEQTDLIDALTAWVLTTALTEIRDLGASMDLPVAVNVSARNFSRNGFADQVVSILNQVDVGADRLIIEITETALLTDPARAGTALAELAAIGVLSSLDDFGQGHTSLGYLSQLPLNEVKIDKGFVTDMLTDPSHAAIVRSIIDLGHNLAFRVVAEGVETADVLSRLKALGCDVAQGYLLARPMPLDDLQKWLTSPAAVPVATP